MCVWVERSVWHRRGLICGPMGTQLMRAKLVKRMGRTRRVGGHSEYPMVTICVSESTVPTQVPIFSLQVPGHLLSSSPVRIGPLGARGRCVPRNGPLWRWQSSHPPRNLYYLVLYLLQPVVVSSPSYRHEFRTETKTRTTLPLAIL